MLYCILKKKLGRGNFFLWATSWEGGVTLPLNYLKTFPGPMRSYTVKKNHIGSAVSEIIRYKQTDRKTFRNLVNFIPGIDAQTW